jgi:RNA polymerase sigma-70 factor, ECF subfamily
VDRREVWAFCYQMLGSPFDADDAVQDVYERVWRARDTFDPDRGTEAGWTFRIARNVCLDRLRSGARRILPRDLQEPGIDVGAPLVPRFDVPWLQPAPSGWCAVDETADAAVHSSEVRLAVTALLLALPASQRAVFVLRELLGYSAVQTAEMLQLSVPAVNSSLQRARAGLRDTTAGQRDDDLSDNVTRRRLETAKVEEFARALESADAVALEQLVTSDVVFEMPPVPAWSRGRSSYRAFMDHLFDWRGTNWATRLTSANNQPALLVYLVNDVDVTPHSVQVLSTDDSELISHVLVYHDPALFRLFEAAGAGGVAMSSKGSARR